MSLDPESIAEASRLVESGEFVQAEAICRRVFAEGTNAAGLWHLLGVGVCQASKDAIGFVCFQKALELDPNLGETHLQLGKLLRRRSKPAEALDCLSRATELLPHSMDATQELASAYADLGKPAKAVTLVLKALARQPNVASLHALLGSLFYEEGNLASAEQSFREAIRLDPGEHEAYLGYGVIQHDRQMFEEALELLTHAQALCPQSKRIRVKIGWTFLRLDQFDRAVACFAETLQIHPNHAPALYGIGVALSEQGKPLEAETYFDQAISADPQAAEYRVGQGMLRLLLGDLENGWDGFELRCKLPDAPVPFHYLGLKDDLAGKARTLKPSIREALLGMRRWNGSSPAGRVLLVYTEQGLGDSIQFSRFMGNLKELGAHTVLRCPASVADLLRSVPGVDQVATEDEDLRYDHHIPLLSLPKVLGITLANLPGRVPYTFPGEKFLAKWRTKLNACCKFKVGIAWQGNPKFARDRKRSVNLAQLEPLTEIAGVQLFSLQKGPGSEQLLELKSPWEIVDLGSRFDSFVDTAAAISNLDLVVSIDSAVAHCAGALGVPVWLMVPFAPDWRWLLNREDTPWYPSMRLFRQERLGDWTGVVERIALALGGLIKVQKP